MNDLYNPCDDGFAAKAWECLRRNEVFIQYFNRESQQSEQHSLLRWSPSVRQRIG